MQEYIEQYLPVHPQFPNGLSQLRKLEEKLNLCAVDPEIEINQILGEQMKRIKARSCSNRNQYQNKIAALEIKKRIHSLKKQVKVLRIKQPKRQTIKYQSKLYSALLRQLNNKKQTCNQQEHRYQLQKKQILSLRKAVEQLDQQINICTTEEQYHMSDDKSIKKLTLLKNKRQQLLKNKQKLSEEYEEIYNQKIQKLQYVEGLEVERQNEERNIARKMNIQKEIIEKIHQQSDDCNTQSDCNSFKIMKKSKTYKKPSKSSSKFTTGLKKYENSSLQNVYMKRETPQSRQLRTLSTEHTPIRQRQYNNLILEKRSSFRTPVNLNPSRYKFHEILNVYKSPSTSQALPLNFRKDSLLRKQSVTSNEISKIRLNESNLDVSMSSSTYNKTKGIELVKQSIVQLSTIKQERRKTIQKRRSTCSSKNPNISLPYSFNKQSLEKSSETTKEEEMFKNQIAKGVPFECDQSEFRNSNQSFLKTRELHRQIPKREFRIPLLSLQQL